MTLRCSSGTCPSSRQYTPRILVSLLWLILGWLAGANRAQSQDFDAQWIRATTEHFTVVSGAGEQAAIEVAGTLEMLHSVLASLAGADPQSPVPTKVFLFPNAAWMRPFSPAATNGITNSGRAVAGGFFAPRPLANFVAINLRTTRDAREVIQHEYLHYFARHNLPRLPFWFSEGLAEYYSTFYVADGIGYVGKPVPSRIKLLAETSHEFDVGWRELEELAELQSVGQLGGDGHAALLAYARSWALVHFLLSDDERTQKTMQFMRELSRGTDSPRAFEESFDEPLESLSRRLNRYLTEGDYRTFKTSVRRTVAPRLEEMAEPEVVVALGELAFAVGNHGAARQLFNRTIEVAAQGEHTYEQQTVLNGLADLGLAQLALGVHDAQGALELATSAADKAPFLADSWVVLGLARQHAALPNPTPGERAAALENVRSAFRTALDRNPDLPLALVSHGKTWVNDPLSSVANRAKKTGDQTDYVQPGIKSLRHELEVSPHGTEGAKLLSALLTLDGQFERGVALLLRERPRFVDEHEWTSAMEAIGEVERKQLYNQLTRGALPALPPTELAALGERLDALEQATDRVSQLSHLFTESVEIRGLFQLESLWTDLDAAKADRDVGESENARQVVEYVLLEVDSNPRWEGPRVERLVKAAKNLRHQLGDDR